MNTPTRITSWIILLTAVVATDQAYAAAHLGRTAGKAAVAALGRSSAAPTTTIIPHPSVSPAIAARVLTAHKTPFKAILHSPHNPVITSINRVLSNSLREPGSVILPTIFPWLPFYKIRCTKAADAPLDILNRSLPASSNPKLPLLNGLRFPSQYLCMAQGHTILVETLIYGSTQIVHESGRIEATLPYLAGHECLVGYSRSIHIRQAKLNAKM